MTQLLIHGKHQLVGDVHLSGDQQTIVAIQAASILATQGTVIVDHVPATASISQMNQLLQSLNVIVEFNRHSQVLKMDATRHLNPVQVSGESLVAAGSILARCRHVRLVDNGINPVYQENIHKLAQYLNQLGATVSDQGHVVDVHADSLQGTQLDLENAGLSVTLAILMVSTMAQGITVIRHPASHPSIFELAKVLNKMGARVHGAGTDTIRVQGVTYLHSTDYFALDDQEEAGVYLAFGALTAGDVVVHGAKEKHLNGLIHYLDQMGNTVITQRHGIRVIGTSLQLPVDISADFYGHSGTYLKMSLLALALQAHGEVQIDNFSPTQRDMLGMVTNENSQFNYVNHRLLVHAPVSSFSQAVTVTSPAGGVLAIGCALGSSEPIKIAPAEMASSSFIHLIDQLTNLGAQIDLKFN